MAVPTFRPDGKALYAIFNIETNDKTYNLDRLAKFSWPNVGQPAILTAKFDRSVGSFAFTPDSQSIYLTAEEAGNEKLFTMPADGGEVTLAMDMTRGVYTNLRIPAKASSTMLFANWESAINPPEVFRLDLNSKTQQPLTSFNAEQVARIDWQPLRHFWFTSKAGKRIHNMIALPPNFDEQQEVSAARSDARWTTQHVARQLGTALELFHALATRLRRVADKLFGLDGIR